MRHRARELMVGQRMSALNALRGLSEIGVVAAEGVDQNEASFTFERAYPSAQTVYESAALLGASRPHR